MHRIRSWFAAAISIAVLAACGGGGGDAATASPPPPPAATAPVAVTVIDTLGRFVAGATLKSGANSATSDASGQATLAVATGGEQVIAVTQAGFAEQFKVVDLPTGTTAATPLQAMLVARAAPQTIGAIEAGGTAAGVQGVKVTFPANALVDAAGQPVSEAIQMTMTPVDVSEVDVGAFPGLFEGIPTAGTRQAIVSVGTSELVPEQGGKKLNLAAGKTADIELPLFVSRRQDGTLLVVGDTVPIWSLDTASGLWKQEGSGTVVASAASPTGLALHATISHFSWWNGDFSAQQATVDLTVNVSGTTLAANTIANVGGTVVSGSGPSSTATGTVVVGNAGQFKVPAASSTTRFTASAQTGTQTCAGSVDVSPPVGSTVSATITMSCVTLDVRLVRPAGDVATNSQSPLPFRIEVDGSTPDSVELFADQTRVAQFGPQFFYAGLWDSSTFAEGSYTLHPRATKAGVVRDGGSITVVVDRTAPQATGFSPAATVEVSRNTSFSVDFDETVLAAPFALSDAIRLTVTPIGSTTPVVVPFTVSQNAAGTTLTVLPAAALPIGVAGLSWGGLHDVAGNAVTGTVAATWNVDRSTFAGPELGHVEFGGDFIGAALAIDVDGSLLAVHKPEPGTFVNLSRYDSATDTWTVLVGAVNERATQDMLSLAIDNNGVPHVAFVQRTAADPQAFELVLKRFNGTAMELAAPVVPLVGARGGDINQGSLAFDNANRAVLTFSDPNVSTVRVFRLEQGVLVSLASVSLAFDPHLALQDDGTPVIAFIQGFGGSNAGAMQVGRVVNGSVQLLGGTIDSVPNATQNIGEPRIVMRGSEPWAFWVKNGLVNAARFDGTNWIAQPFVAPVNGGFDIDARLFNGDPIIAAGDVGTINVLRFRNGAWEPPFDATGRADHQDRIQIAVRGNSAAMISSSIFRNAADVQLLSFP